MTQIFKTHNPEARGTELADLMHEAQRFVAHDQRCKAPACSHISLSVGKAEVLADPACYSELSSQTFGKVLLIQWEWKQGFDPI